MEEIKVDLNLLVITTKVTKVATHNTRIKIIINIIKIKAKTKEANHNTTQRINSMAGKLMIKARWFKVKSTKQERWTIQ